MDIVSVCEVMSCVRLLFHAVYYISVYSWHTDSTRRPKPTACRTETRPWTSCM